MPLITSTVSKSPHQQLGAPAPAQVVMRALLAVLVWLAAVCHLPGMAAVLPQLAAPNMQAVSSSAIPTSQTRQLSMDPALTQQLYIKPHNTSRGAQFGYSVAIDGDTMVVGAQFESSNASGILDTSTSAASGAAYVFVRDAQGAWQQQAMLKASNTGKGDQFGNAVAISGDTIVVGALFEQSNATGVNGDQSDNSIYQGGAAYVFTRTAGNWSQQAYLKASNAKATGTTPSTAGQRFGYSVGISGQTIVVGAVGERSASTTDQSNNSLNDAGAAYVFVYDDSLPEKWKQQAYLKAASPVANASFGLAVAIDGDRVAVGAHRDRVGSVSSGAAYVFERQPLDGSWGPPTQLHASNFGINDYFGTAIAISGSTVVVGASREGSSLTGVNNSAPDNNDVLNSGAAYVFVRNAAGSWGQQAYLKASNTRRNAYFGESVAISGDSVVVGSWGESSAATGVNGDQSASSIRYPGAAYHFVRDSQGQWSQQNYLKASNTDADDYFAKSVAIQGHTVVISAPMEDSSAKGINGNQGNDPNTTDSGAVYLFTPSADLAVAVENLGAVTAGEAVSYTVTASNVGTGGVPDARLIHTVPAAFLNASWTCELNDGTPCATASGVGDIDERTDLAPAQSAIYTVSATVDIHATGSISNSASVAAPVDITELDASNNSDTQSYLVDPPLIKADLSARLQLETSAVTAGEAIRYTITVSNAGPSAVAGAGVSHTIPSGLVNASWACAYADGSPCANAAGNGNIAELVALPAGANMVYTVSATVDASATGTITSSASVAAPAGIVETDPGNNSDTQTYPIGTALIKADLSVRQQLLTNSATAGEAIRYSITVSNAGPSAVAGAALSHTIPSGLVNASWTCAYADDSLCANAVGNGNIAELVTLPAGASMVYTVSATVDADTTGAITSSASVAAPAGVVETDPSNNSNTQTYTVGAALIKVNLGVAFGAAGSSTLAGKSVSFPLSVSNTGPDAATGALLSYQLPASFSSANWVCVASGGASCGASSGSGNINATVTLPAGSTLSYQITAEVSGAATGSISNHASVQAPTGAIDTDTSNNNAQALVLPVVGGVVALPEGSAELEFAGAGCVLQSGPTYHEAPATGGPAGYRFPFGQLGFQATSCQPMGQLQVEIRLPEAVPNDAKLFKQLNGEWIEWPANFADAKVQFRIQDDDGSSTATDTGDSNPAPGSITDPVLLAVPSKVEAAKPVAVPGLGPWALALLSLLTSGMGGLLLMRRGHPLR